MPAIIFPLFPSSVQQELTARLFSISKGFLLELPSWFVRVARRNHYTSLDRWITSSKAIVGFPQLYCNLSGRMLYLPDLAWYRAEMRRVKQE